MDNYFSNVKTIYSHMQDDISRRIYANRILFNYTDDPRFLRAMINESPFIQQFISKLNDHSDQELVIFGAGLYGRRLKKYFPEYSWKLFADNNLSANTVDGIPLINASELAGKHNNAYIVISPRVNSSEIKTQLLETGLSEKNIIILNNYINRLETGIYFDVPGIPHTQNEVFVDGGALDGSSSSDFIKWSGNNYSKIYLFEPNSEMLEVINNNLKGQENINLFRKGLWNKPRDLYYTINPENPGEGTISEECISNDSITVPVTSIDEALDGIPVTYIKMDIEGSEEEALIGAQKTICAHRPKLAISIYHKKADIFTLPSLLLSYNPDYRFYVRHYTMGPCDTVLYAV